LIALSFVASTSSSDATSSGSAITSSLSARANISASTGQPAGR
jgi:hypothetical protein